LSATGSSSSLPFNSSTPLLDASGVFYFSLDITYVCGYNAEKGENPMPNINDRVRFRTEHHTIEGTVDHVQKIGKCRVKTDDGAYYLVDSEECEILTGVNE